MIYAIVLKGLGALGLVHLFGPRYVSTGVMYSPSTGVWPAYIIGSQMPIASLAKVAWGTFPFP